MTVRKPNKERHLLILDEAPDTPRTSHRKCEATIPHEYTYVAMAGP